MRQEWALSVILDNSGQSFIAHFQQWKESKENRDLERVDLTKART